MTDNPFEMPGMRDLAEQNMRQAQSAFEQLADFKNETASIEMGAMQSPMATGFKDARERAMDCAMNNAESALRLAGRVCNAKTLEELLTLQTPFAQGQMQAYVAQKQELCGLIGGTVQSSGRS